MLLCNIYLSDKNNDLCVTQVMNCINPLIPGGDKVCSSMCNLFCYHQALKG